MRPDFLTQLQAVIKALEFVVSPSIVAGDGLASEQLHVSIQTLRIIQEHLCFSRRAARLELSNAVSLAEGLQELIANSALKVSLDRVLAASREALLDPVLENDELGKLADRVLSAISAITAADGGFVDEVSAARVILNRSKVQIDLARCWYQRGGFEPDNATGLSIDTLIQNAR